MTDKKQNSESTCGDAGQENHKSNNQGLTPLQNNQQEECK